MPTSTKLRNPAIIVVGSRDMFMYSTQWSHPSSSRFRHCCPLFGDNSYPPSKSTTQNQNLFLRKDFYFLPIQAKKKQRNKFWFCVVLLDGGSHCPQTEGANGKTCKCVTIGHYADPLNRHWLRLQFALPSKKLAVK